MWSDGETIENLIIDGGKIGLNTSVVTGCLLPTDEKFHYAIIMLLLHYSSRVEDVPEHILHPARLPT